MNGKNGAMVITTTIDGTQYDMTPITDYVSSHDGLDDTITRTLRRWGRNGTSDKLPAGVVVANVFGRWCINVDATVTANDVDVQTRDVHAGTRFIIHVPSTMVDDDGHLTDDARAWFASNDVDVTNPRIKRAERKRRANDDTDGTQ